jgi:PAS domain S-box-containing protein
MAGHKTSSPVGKASRRIQLRSYGVTLLSVALALGVTLLLRPWLQPTIMPIFMLAVMVSAWYGGWKTGLVATVLSTLAINYFFIEPLYSLHILNVETIVQLSTFLTVAGAIGLLNQSRSTALESAKENLQALQAAMSREQMALAEAETANERIETVLSSINDGFYVLDRDWRFTYVNARYCEIVGMPPSELLGRNIWELFPAAVDTEAYVQFHQAMSDRTPRQFDYLYAPWNCWHDHRIYPSPNGLTVLLADITERKQANEDLRLNRDRLAFVLRTTEIGLWLNSLPLSGLNWDDRTKELFFIPPNVEPTIELFWSRVHPEDRESTRLAVENALRDRTLYQIDHRAVNPSTGEIRWIRSAGKATYAPDGTPIRFDGINYDISDRKQAEAQRERTLQYEQASRQQAEAAEAKLQQILSSLREDFVLFDRDWHVAYLNERAAMTMRKSREEVLGRCFWDLFPDLVGTEFYDRLHQVRDDRTPTQFEYYYPTWDRWFENRMYPTPDGVVSLSTDITDRKRYELNQEFLDRLEARLQQLSVSESMVSAVVSGVGEYLNVDLCLWHGVDLERHVAIIGQNWRRGNIPDLTGIYDLDAFFTPKQLEIFAAGQTLVVGDVTTHPDTASHAQNYLSLGVSSFVSVPCIQSGWWVASLAIDSAVVRDWRADEVALLQEVVTRLWSTIERTRAVQELRQSEAEFRQLANAMPQIVYVSNAAGALEFVNDRWTEYTGLTIEQSVDLDWTRDVIPLEDRERLQADFQQAQQARSPYQSQFRLIKPDGSYLYFLTRAVPLLDDRGEVCKWYGTSTDITELKQLEAELRQKNAILDIINESAPTPIFVKDRQGRIIYANPATLAVVGKTAEEVIGYRDCDFYPNPEDAAKVMANDRRIIESGEMEVVEESPDGIRTFLGMKVPYRNEAGEIIGLIGISNDITDRVQFERDREKTIQQEQAARQAAENANRIKDEFLAVVSHELRTPLNPILGWSQLLQRGKLNEEKTKFALSTIERNARLQSQLIDDLLDISRILRGKLSLNITSVNLSGVISSALETVRLAAEAKTIELQFEVKSQESEVRSQESEVRSQKSGVRSQKSGVREYLSLSSSPHPPISPSPHLHVMGDPGRLQQVVWNLLSNAVKFTPPSGRIAIKLTQSGDRAQIQVIDTGKGINPDFLPYVFEHFRQEDGAITRKFGGLGLGLAIARQIVEMHGGTIAVDSPGEDRGATFTVLLPLASVSVEMAAETQASAATLDLSGLKILAVDDETDSREFMAFVLEEAGAIVATAASATEALEAIDREHPDLIVSDIGMPDIDGYMLMQQIRSQAQTRDIPAIALTAYAGEFDRQQAIAAGFQTHLAKPVEPEVLVKAIADAIKGIGNNIRSA